MNTSNVGELTHTAPAVGLARYLVATEAAAYLRTTVQAVYSLVKRGRIKPMPGRPGRLLFTRREPGRVPAGEVCSAVRKTCWRGEQAVDRRLFEAGSAKGARGAEGLRPLTKSDWWKRSGWTRGQAGAAVTDFGLDSQEH